MPPVRSFCHAARGVDMTVGRISRAPNYSETLVSCFGFVFFSLLSSPFVLCFQAFLIRMV